MMRAKTRVRYSEASFPDAVRGLVSALLEAEGINPALHRVLIEEVLRTSARAELAGFEERLETVVVDALRRAGCHVDVPDVRLAAFLLVRMVLALVHAAVVDRPEADRSELVSEMARLVLRYLAPS